MLAPQSAPEFAIEARGLDSKRNLDTPRDFHDVAWYNRGPAPGERGNALINGHVNGSTLDATVQDYRCTRHLTLHRT